MRYRPLLINYNNNDGERTSGPAGSELNVSTKSDRCFGATDPFIVQQRNPAFSKWSSTISSIFVHCDTTTLQPWQNIMEHYNNHTMYLPIYWLLRANYQSQKELKTCHKS